MGPQGLERADEKTWRWTPDYRIADGKHEGESYTVDGVESAECPVSAITHDSIAWLAEHDQARWMKDAGAAAYGPNLGDWPARALDAHQLLQIEESRVDTARYEATK